VLPPILRRTRRFFLERQFLFLSCSTFSRAFLSALLSGGPRFSASVFVAAVFRISKVATVVFLVGRLFGPVPLPQGEVLSSAL